MTIILYCTTVVRPGILRITVLSIYGMLIERLWIMLATSSIDHARCVRFISTTGTMKHAISDGLIEKRILILVRKLSRHDIINLICIMNFVVWMKKDEAMHVWKATFLKFYCVEYCLHSPK